jgi:hypothetical protein
VSSNRTGADQRDNNRQKPSLQPTNPATLIVAALGAAAVGWIMVARDYNGFPSLTWLPTFITLGLAALETAAAIATRARIERRPGAIPVDPHIAVRYVVLAKASSIAGALFAGFFGAVGVWLLVERSRLAAASNDLPPAIGGFVGAVALLVAALVLERSCRVPPRPDDEDETGEAL